MPQERIEDAVSSLYGEVGLKEARKAIRLYRK
jgi:hypothetical protein